MRGHRCEYERSYSTARGLSFVIRAIHAFLSVSKLHDHYLTRFTVRTSCICRTGNTSYISKAGEFRVFCSLLFGNVNTGKEMKFFFSSYRASSSRSLKDPTISELVLRSHHESGAATLVNLNTNHLKTLQFPRIDLSLVKIT